jgi:hypothetical protein
LIINQVFFSRLQVVFWKHWKIIWHIWKVKRYHNHQFQGKYEELIDFELIIFFRQQTEQDLKSFSRDLIFNDSDDPQKILEEEAKALAQFNKVCFYFIHCILIYSDHI